MEIPLSPLKRLRLKLGMSRVRFARAIGISAQTLGKVECGDIRLPVKCIPGLPRLGADPMAMLVAQENYIRDRRCFRKAIRDT